MYSVNLNEEDKNKKNRKYESMFSENKDLLGEHGDVVQQQSLGTGVLKENVNKDIVYGKNDVFGNTVYASSIAQKEKEAPVSPIVDMDYLKQKNYKFPQLLSESLPEMKSDGVASWGKKPMHITPESVSRRSEYLYSVSPRAVKDVASDYFKDELGTVYDKKLDDARVHSNMAFAEYGQDAVAAMRIAQERSDPMAAIDATMKEVDDEKLRKMVAPLANRGGFDTDMYINDYVKPALRDMMINDYIDKNKPENSGEYILRSAYKDSLVGKATNIGFGNKSFALIEDESLARYDANNFEKFAAGIGSLLIDTPAFAGIGALSSRFVGKATAMATKRLAERLYSYGAAEGMSRAYAGKLADRAMLSSLNTRIAQNATTQGLTLGIYDLSNSIAEDVIYNDSIDVKKAAGRFTKGFLTGGISGGVGTGLRRMAGGLTGGKKLLASARVLSAESAVFTLSTEMDKLMNDVEIEPIDLLNDFAESTATLGVMKLAHWRPKGKENKLKEDGTLKDELKLSKSEQEELREINIDPVVFMNEVEMAMNLPSFGVGKTGQSITDRYIEMMQSKDVSATTKSKLMYLVENKLTSTPPVAFDYDVERNRNGKWVLTTYDFEGNKVERRVFEHAGNVKSQLLVEKGRLRNNRIAAFERELFQGVESQNLLRQAGLYAKEKSVSVEDVSEALFKRAKNIPLSGWEDMLVRDILDRTAYDQSGMVQFLSDMRRKIEKKHGLEDGSLLVSAKQQFYNCTNKENSALDEYEAMIRGEVNALKQGTDRKRAAEFRQLGKNSRFRGMGNEEVKAMEVNDFYTRHPDKIDAVGSGYNEKPIKIDDGESSEYVWSYDGVDNTVEDLKVYRKHALELADKFDFKVNFITNEREIPSPDVNDKIDVMNFNNKVRSMGWLDGDGKITINLPNIPSIEELEKTVVHECVAHGGLLKLFGNHLNSFLEEVYRKASGEVRVAINDVKRQYPFLDNYTVIEEYLAHLTEKVGLSTGERAMYTGFKDFVRNSLVRLNLYTGRNRRITESDLKSLLRQHAKYIEKRTPPSEYRRWVFGHFDAAKQKENTYYDRGAYEVDTREKIAGGKYFIKTPAPLYTSKILKNYDLLPEEKRQQVLKRWRTTDEHVRRMLSDIKHRIGSGKDAGNALPENGKLKEVYDDPDFYSRYPELANLPVEMLGNAELPVSYDARNRKLILDRNFFANPENQVYMSDVLHDVVRDYEGFNKAVSMNLFGINSKLGRKYDEAQKIVEAIASARRANPDFDKNGYVDKAFEKEYGFTPNEFKKRFPSLDEYTIYKLTGEGIPFSEDAVSPAAVTGKGNSNSVIKNLGDLMKYFNGPLDIVYRKLQQIHSDDQRSFEKIQEPGNDYGYGEFKKRQDDQRKRLSDAAEFNKWRNSFRHFDDELDELN